MKEKLFLLLILVSALNLPKTMAANYEEDWKKVEQLEDEGRTKDALESVKAILAKARKEKDDPQTIKAQLYKYKYMMRLEEESEWKIAQEIKQNIAAAEGAEKALLQSILAELYAQYYDENSWKFIERTQTAEKPGEDFRTWDLQTLFEEIRHQYLASLENKAVLQQTKLSGLGAIIEKEKNSQKVRPTLYDLLAHRAIDFFSSENADLTQPANAFAIDNKKYFSTASEFVTLDLPGDDTLSNAYNALLVFRDLLRFRLQDNNLDALADADLKRVEYVREHYFSDEEAAPLYLAALQRLKVEYVKCPMGATINYVLANYLYVESLEKNPAFLYRPKDALKICNETIQNYPQSDGAKNCEALKLTIFNKELNLTTDKTLVPGETTKALVQFRNIGKIYLKWVPVDYRNRDKIFDLKNKETEADVIKRLNAKKAIKSWTQTLPDAGDYLSHSAEIRIEAMKPGYYALMASTNPAFDITAGKEAVSVTTLFVSQISYAVRENNSSLFEAYVLERNTGLPLKDASVRLFHLEYDYNARKYKNVEYGTVLSDANGYVTKKINGPKTDYYNGHYYNFEITYRSEFLPSEQNFYAYDYPKNPPTDQWQTFLFTDRAIYRPGQTIYFKGILLKNNGEQHELLTAQKISVVLRDVNDQEVRTETFTTNDFGSFNGTFTAPSTGLLGEMTLQTPYGSQAIRVEEYKRPKFEVLFDTVKTAYNLNDTVTVTGKAVSYAGASLDNAQVKYKVMRTARFPIWCWWGWRKPWFPSSPARMIATGTAMTDASGKFSIDFTAIPDFSVSKEFKPYFDYEIVADVTDINGETQSATTSMRVGYLSIDVNLQVGERLEREKENSISVSTNNLNGQPEPTIVTLKIYDLIEPQNPKRSKLWNAPDTFAMKKSEHDALFPYDIYNNEDIPENWTKGSLLNTYSFNTGAQSNVVLPANSLNSGACLIEFSCKDKSGQAIEFKKTFTVYSNGDGQLLPKQFAWMNIPKTTLQPGENLVYQLGTSMQDAYFVVEVMHKDTLIDKQQITINNGIKTFSIPVRESYRGGMEIRFACVSKNRIYNGYQFVQVPFPDNDLKVEWMTFRDKLLPGQKESWKLKIKGPGQEKAAAELLAAMYDASLDAFVPHGFNFYLPGGYYSGFLKAYSGFDAFGIQNSRLYESKGWNPYKNIIIQGYDQLDLFGLSFGGWTRYKNIMYLSAPQMAMETVTVSGKSSKKESKAEEEALMDSAAAPPKPGEGAGTGDIKYDPTQPEAVKPKPMVSPRTNLNETAFFFPQLNTDDSGNVVLNFTMPEALTKWKFLGFAHNKQLQFVNFNKTVQTQKDLMVVPNAPRFLREGDRLEFTAKITNLSAGDLEGKADLVLYDAATMKEITYKIMEAVHGTMSSMGERDFSVKAGSNTVVSWVLNIPAGIGAIYYKVTAQAGDFSDGEAAALPVLPNRMLVTESMPLWVNGKSTKNFTFEKLLNAKSSTLKNYSLTLELTSNPVWYAVQALPYMMEYPYECAEQLFSRYYANALASHIANANPRLKQVFDQWKNSQALISNLEKNQDLKNVLLEETPWVREAQDESEQKKRIALLFDLNRMANEKATALSKLAQMQTPNGGYTWFPGMPDNRYITAYIVAGFGHLDKLKVIDVKTEPTLSQALPKAVNYLDQRMREAYEDIKKYDKDFEKNNHLYYDVIYYLYARSFFPQVELEKKNQEAYDYYLRQCKKFWLDNGLYAQGLIALVLQRNNDAATAGKIIEAMRQNAIRSEELGMYWKANEKAGWYWYEAPVETQALLIEAFTEVGKDEASVDAMKVWLLKQKQTTAWKSTKATAEACYALLLSGTDWVSSTNLVEVKMGKDIIDPKAMNVSVEPGTGYYKARWDGEQVKPEMAKVQLKKSDKGPAWGAVYWQYFEDLDKISGANTSLQLSKQYFKKVTTGKGDILQPITEQSPIKVGDLITVRIELRTDRNLEYVHLKDLRAAGMEPTNVLSAYKYQDNLGYYESTRDVATHFFMDWMPKGIYVFEYTLRASLPGEFSSGITQIECMYAPEFKAHSKGERQRITK